MARKEEILTSSEARRYLKIGRTKLWQLTKEQMIPSYRLGKSPNASLRYKRSELLRWLERNRLVSEESGGNGDRD
jgi:excisionase family DNA binding protein